jgi:hypothetical protein
MIFMVLYPQTQYDDVILSEAKNLLFQTGSRCRNTF